MGLSGSIPLFLKERGVSLQEIALFSFVSMPFSLKIFWAPLVDSIYIKQFGRRKSWIIPIQIFCGAILVTTASYVNQWIGNTPDGNVDADNHNVLALTVYFTFQFFLMATQDIAVDGWALTLLSAKNVGYATVCNNIGQSVGYFLAFNGLIAFTDPIWCDRHKNYIPHYQKHGDVLITFESFIVFIGVLFIFSTAIIGIFKPEYPEPEKEDEETLTVDSLGYHIDHHTAPEKSKSHNTQSHWEEGVQHVYDTFKQSIALFSLASVQLLCLVIFTRKWGIAAADAGMTLKLQEYGMPKVDIVTFSTLSLVMSLVLPTIIKITKPLEMWLFVFKLKIVVDIASLLFFQYAAFSYRNPEVEPGLIFFGAFGIVTISNQIINSLLFTCMGYFFNVIADADIGGTYITLLNAVMNVGSLIPNSIVLWLMPLLTFEFEYEAKVLQSVCVGTNSSSYCELVDYFNAQLSMISNIAVNHELPICNSSIDMIIGCVKKGTIDGFTICIIASTIIGLIWYSQCKHIFRTLQGYDKSLWSISKRKI